MGKCKYMYMYNMFIGIFTKKNVTAEEPRNPYSTISQMPVFLLRYPASKLQIVLGSLLQPIP